MSHQTEYGRLSTLHDHLLYDILQEQRKTNALLEQFLQTKKESSVEAVQNFPVEESVQQAVEETPKRRRRNRSE